MQCLTCINAHTVHREAGPTNLCLQHDTWSKLHAYVVEPQRLAPIPKSTWKKKVWNVDVVGLFSLVWCPNWYITFRLPTLEKFSPSFIRIHHQLFFISSIYIHPSLSIDTCVHHPLSVVFVGSLVALLHHPFCSLFNYILFHYQPACIGTTTFTHLYYKHWRGLGIFRLEFQIVVF